MLWTALSLLFPARDARERHARTAGPGAAYAALVFAMILTGGLVAGLRAGFAYNTFPLMNGHVVPPGILLLEPAWKNFFWNMATVQFDHRALAWTLALVTPLLWWHVQRAPGSSRRARVAAHAVLAMLAVQVTLGIATLVNVVPLPLAAAHQAGALLLFALALNLAHALDRPVAKGAANADDDVRIPGSPRFTEH